MNTCPRCPHAIHSGVCGQNCGVPGFPSTYVSCKCVEPATPVEAVTESWPRAAERFMSKVQKTPTCWIWTASHSGNGYGKFTDYGKHYAHRYSYELYVGPIPGGQTVDHLCRNKSCVNPEHLELVSREENTRRAAPHISYFNKFDRETCIRGHAWTPENTSVRSDSGTRRCKVCAREDMARARSEGRSA